MRILGIYVGDANGDGKNELIVIREGMIEIFAYMGTFEKTHEIKADVFGFNKRSIFVDDIDADGFPEILIGYIDKERKVHIEIRRLDELISSISSAVPGGDVYGIFSADINNDKTQELIAFGSNSQGYTTMTVRLPTKPKLMRLDRIPIGVSLVDVCVGDVDGDGEMEALALSKEGIYYRKKGMKRFDRYPIEAYDTHQVELADVNGDLYMELILGTRSGVYVYSGKELIEEFNVGADVMVVHDVDNDGADEIITYQAGKIYVIDVESKRIEQKDVPKAIKFLVAGKFGEKRLIIAANEEEFRIAAEYQFSVPNVIDEFKRVSVRYKPLLARYILQVAYGGEAEGLEGELLNEARRELNKGDLNRAYRILYQLLEGNLPNPKKAARIAVLFSYYLMKNPRSKLREMLEELAKEEKREEKKKERRVVNPREALERLKAGTATEDDFLAVVALYLHDPNRLKGKVSEFFELVRKQFGSSAALDALLTIFTAAPKSLRAEILLTILANYMKGKLFPNEIRAAFKRAAKRSTKDRDLLELFADIVLKYGQRGMAALISALSYTQANPEAVRLIPEPSFNFRPSRPVRIEEISIPDARLVPLIIHGKVKVTMKKDVSSVVFRIHT